MTYKNEFVVPFECTGPGGNANGGEATTEIGNIHGELIAIYLEDDARLQSLVVGEQMLIFKHPTREDIPLKTPIFVSYQIHPSELIQITTRKGPFRGYLRMRKNL